VSVADRHPSSDLLAEVAARVGTPSYVYDVRFLDAAAAAWIRAAGGPQGIFYSVKANSNLAVLRRVAGHGIGLEVATAGEFARARRAGVPADRIVFGGVPKSPAVVRDALHSGVDLLVLQAEHEFEAAVAGARRRELVRVGVRVRPGIRAGSHPSLETARVDAKFGIAPTALPEVWERLACTPGLIPTTLAVHLGSGLASPEPYERAVDLLLELRACLANGRLPVTELDLGGGLGVDYGSDDDPDPAGVVGAVARRTGADAESAALQIRYEPGRSLVARCGTLLTRVLYRRERETGPALVCDAGHTDFVRYALYGARHRIEPVVGSSAGPATVEVLGPTCESGDVLGIGYPLHDSGPGDLLMLRDAGAYGFVMASNYNSRPRPAEVMTDGSEWWVVREREAPSDLWRGEDDGRVE